MRNADVIVFSTPIYYYEMTGQMKTLLDRVNPLFSSEYAFRDIYILTTAADDDQIAAEKAISGLNGWIDCFEHANFKGSVFAGGLVDGGEIINHKALKEAYDLGYSIK